MTTLENIINLLESNNVSFQKLEHEEVRTSHEAGELIERQSLGLTIKNGAKALLLKAKTRSGEDKIFMHVLPGDKKFNSKDLKLQVGAKELHFLTEDEVILVTNGVKPGGVPPFGSIFGIQTYIDPDLFKVDQIVFNAGNKAVSIVMATSDYIRLSQNSNKS